MPLPKISSKTPTSIGRIEITVVEDNGIFYAKCTVHVLDQDGKWMATERIEDLQPYLGPAQLTALAGIMTAIRGKAESEIL